MGKAIKGGDIAEANVGKSIHSESMKLKYVHGHDFQKQVYDWFEFAGFTANFFSISDGLGKRHADYQYDGNWVEAKTYIGDSDVTKILRLKPFLDMEGITMIVMCEFASNSKEGKSHRKNINHLIDAGILVYQGEQECIGFITAEKLIKGYSKEIRMARGINVPLRLLYPNPDNRDLVISNWKPLNKSIKENGFFTQLNIVPHFVNENGEQTYMLYEGHNRLNQLLELSEKGYNIPDVCCSLVDWVTSSEIQKLHTLLITTNTTVKNWKLRDYVKSNLSYFGRMNMDSRKAVFEKIDYWMKQANKNKWGETVPPYVFVHQTDMDFGNIESIKNGTYDITDSDYKNVVLPLFTMINDLCISTESSINGTLVRQILVETKVKYNTNTKFKKYFKKYIEYVSDYLASLIYNKKDLPGDKAGINEFIKTMNNVFEKRFMK